MQILHSWAEGGRDEGGMVGRRSMNFWAGVGVGVGRVFVGWGW